MNYYVVKYTGPFGFIKPWTAVRDELTYSQQFLTPSILEGLRQKLEVWEILRHRLSYVALDKQQEQTRPKLIKKPGQNYSILTRGVMLNPILTLALSTEEDANKAFNQHICLCRNEDLLFPLSEKGVKSMTKEEFDQIPGFELYPSDSENGFMVGYDRFNNFQPMYGQLAITEGAIREAAL
jgi:hypothetical protein